MDILNEVVVRKEAVGTCVLCVIDFSEASKNALKTAMTIADSTHSSLTVLYPYRLNKPMNVPNIGEWKKSIEVDANNSFVRMTNNLFKETNISWQFKPEVGFVADRIEAFSEKNSVSVVVMCSELARATDGAFVDMLDRLRCPLLIVPNNQN